MEFKIFGKSIFSYKKDIAQQLLDSSQQTKEKFLPDFYENLSNSNPYLVFSPVDGVVSQVGGEKKGDKKKDKSNTEIQLTPKGVHHLRLLHEDSFTINSDPVYVDDQIQTFKDKLAIINTADYDMRNGQREVASILIRMENRKKYETHKEVFEEFAYTTTTKINEVIAKHNYLKIGKVEQFLADMPKEATEAMKRYNKGCQELCEKNARFYIIANKKDFEKTDKRRDPILLAQSPFGHFWQILGAWDEEMLLLEEL